MENLTLSPGVPPSDKAITASGLISVYGVSEVNVTCKGKKSFGTDDDALKIQQINQNTLNLYTILRENIKKKHLRELQSPTLL